MSYTYPKIETLFDRNEDFSVDTSRLRRPEYDVVGKWVLTEKVDGTNIRLMFTSDSQGGVYTEVRGKSDNASIHPKLLAHLNDECIRVAPEVAKIMEEHTLDYLTLFGEGYGEKIQSGGRYRSTSKDQAFILFDVCAREAWLGEQRVTATADRLGIRRVPVLSHAATLGDAIDLCRGVGFASDVAEQFDADFKAEGVVAKTTVPLYDQRGGRVIWKLKSKDFRAGKR